MKSKIKTPYDPTQLTCPTEPTRPHTPSKPKKPVSPKKVDWVETPRSTDISVANTLHAKRPKKKGIPNSTRKVTSPKLQSFLFLVSFSPFLCNNYSLPATYLTLTFTMRFVSPYHFILHERAKPYNNMVYKDGYWRILFNSYSITSEK